MAELIQIWELIFPRFAKCIKFFKATVLAYSFDGAQSQKFNMEPQNHRFQVLGISFFWVLFFQLPVDNSPLPKLVRHIETPRSRTTDWSWLVLSNCFNRTHPLVGEASIGWWNIHWLVKDSWIPTGPFSNIHESPTDPMHGIERRKWHQDNATGRRLVVGRTFWNKHHWTTSKILAAHVDREIGAHSTISHMKGCFTL